MCNNAEYAFLSQKIAFLALTKPKHADELIILVIKQYQGVLASPLSP